MPRHRSGTTYSRSSRAFVVFLICALAEVNRPPFDLAEAESELVAGFHTEYSGIAFAMFMLSEYVQRRGRVLDRGHAVPGWLARAVAVRRPPVRGRRRAVVPVQGHVASCTCSCWSAATLPRMRYDRLMNFGWKYLIPFGLFWVLATGAIIVLPDRYGHQRGAYHRGRAIVAAWLLGSMVKPLLEARQKEVAA